MARTLPLIALLGLLAACGRDGAREPFVDSQVPPGLAGRFYPPEGWAWGLVQAGDLPPQRYGVGSPPVVPRADVLVIPGTGESAEVWYETARDLVSRGATVWILDRAGQAGSGRFGGRRDIAHVPSFEAEAAGLRAMRETVILRRPERRFVILASADGAVPVLRTLQGAPMPVDHVVLSSPQLSRGETPTASARLAVGVGLGRLPAPGAVPWRRGGPDGVALGLTHDRRRGGVADLWRLANPDLRISGQSLGWRAAYGAASRLAWEEATKVSAPVMMLLPGGDTAEAERLCRRLPRCEARKIAGARPAPHLETESVRGSWLDLTARAVLNQPID
jgi:lysophospholipase